MKIDLDQIRELLNVVSRTDITELTIESGDQKITIRKAEKTFLPTTIEVPASITQVVPRVAASHTEMEHENTSNGEDRSAANGWIPITSPMVGTFYRAPNPTSSPFVDIGDRVAPGQTVCIIEAMKLMNDLPSEVAGKIMKVCVDNGTTVEYGQTLFMVDPNG